MHWPRALTIALPALLLLAIAPAVLSAPAGLLALIVSAIILAISAMLLWRRHTAEPALDALKNPGLAIRSANPEKESLYGRNRSSLLRHQMEQLKNQLPQGEQHEALQDTLKRIELISNIDHEITWSDPLAIIDQALMTVAPFAADLQTGVSFPADLPGELELDRNGLFNQLMEQLLSNCPSISNPERSRSSVTSAGSRSAGPAMILSCAVEDLTVRIDLAAGAVGNEPLIIQALASRNATLNHSPKTILVIVPDTRRRTELIHRLARLGHKAVTGPDTTAACCIIEDIHCAAYQALRQTLPSNLPLLLLNDPRGDREIHGLPVAEPLTQDHLQQAIEAVSHSPLATESQRILLVDDHPANLKLLQSQLSDLGLTADPASSGIEALKLASDNQYDLVFMDIQMPDMNGLEATRRLLSQNPETRVVGLTAHATPEEKNRYRAAGMSDVVIKPMRLALLSQLVQTGPRKNPMRAPRQQLLPVFDRTLALQNANQRPEIAKELFDLLIESLPTVQQAINASIEDAAALRQAVHRLNGALLYSGAPRLANAANRLEIALKNEPELIVPMLNLLNGEITALLSWARFNPDIFSGPGASIEHRARLEGEPTRS
ncbi:MAG: response regulator [Proteobacteria bacterium]|nr:response regulator [Pseudomonadota bacterium]